MYLIITKDEEYLQILQQVESFIRSNNRGLYPKEELKWITTNAWNLGLQKILCLNSDIGQAFIHRSISLAEIGSVFTTDEMVRNC